MKKLFTIAVCALFNPMFGQYNIVIPDTNINSGVTRNVFIGHLAGNDASSGSNNTLIGVVAGVNFKGSNNVALGDSAGFYTTAASSGNICIGSNSGYSNKFGVHDTTGNKLFIDNSKTETPLIWGDFANDQLKFNGKVGVGFVNSFPSLSGTADVSNYNLFVNGGILTEEVRVSLNSTWADYVFKKDYKLATLNEVEAFIQKNGHLKNVPSAKEVAANGIELGEIVKIQQEKIEELTLYIIDQNKANEKQNKEIEELKALVKNLVEKSK